MMITEVADLLDISPHTLRYYERAGLVGVARDSNGHRVYNAAALRRLVFLTRMRQEHPIGCAEGKTAVS